MNDTSEPNPSEDAASPTPSVSGDAEARLRQCSDLFPQMLQDWQEQHPEWRLEALLWILDRALRSLRGYLERDGENEVTWENPHVELRFPLDCVWAEHSTPESPHFHLKTGDLTLEDAADLGMASAAMSRLLVRHLEIAALQDWTNYSAFEKRGDRYRAVGSAELLDEVSSISDPEARALASDALFWPKSFGAGTIDCGSIAEGGPIGRVVAEQLAAVEPPLIVLPLEIAGHRVRLITILEIKPFIADAEAGTAYFLILAGLAVQADFGEPAAQDWWEQPWASLSHWSDESRRAIWDVLHQLIEELLKELGPALEPEMEEAILTVTAEVKVLVPKGARDILKRTSAEVADYFHSKGEIMRLAIERRGDGSADQTLKQRIKELITWVDEAKGNDEKGKSLEALVSTLFESVSGFSVAQRVKTETEEIDIWITNDFDSRAMRREGDVILAECKNWSAKCGKNEFNALLLKMMNRSRRCTLGFLISWNGFADTVTKEMLRGSREEVLIVPLDGNELRACADSGDFLALLLRARQRALMA
jgi:hypothetical protein